MNKTNNMVQDNIQDKSTKPNVTCLTWKLRKTVTKVLAMMVPREGKVEDDVRC
jgi:hypothetical protein